LDFIKRITEGCWYINLQQGGKVMLRNEPPVILDWPKADCTLTPYEIFTSKEIFEAEQEKIFRGPVWDYLGLEAEIPNSGDFLTCWVGTTPIVVCRNKDNSISAFVNRCAHRGNQVVREVRGNADLHTCIYHQWVYDTQGDLQSVALQRGIKTDEGFKSGYPKDFDKQNHCLQKLHVDSHAGMIFGTFSEETPPLHDYLGPVLVERMSYIMRDGKIKINGYQRHTMQCNWKMMAENSRDMYHAPQLHAFFEVFGIFTNNDTGTVQTFDNGHSLNTGWSARSEDGAPNSRSEYTLEDPSVVNYFDERDGMTLSVANLFPIGLITVVNNSLSIRQLRPKGPDSLELHYTWFTYEDDDEGKLTSRRAQRNVFGPSGLVAAEDAVVLEMIQRSINEGSAASAETAILEMGGRGTENTDYFPTEAPLRGFYKKYIELMEFNILDAQAAE